MQNDKLKGQYYDQYIKKLASRNNLNVQLNLLEDNIKAVQDILDKEFDKVSDARVELLNKLNDTIVKYNLLKDRYINYKETLDIAHSNKSATILENLSENIITEAEKYNVNVFDLDRPIGTKKVDLSYSDDVTLSNFSIQKMNISDVRQIDSNIICYVRYTIMCTAEEYVNIHNKTFVTDDFEIVLPANDTTTNFVVNHIGCREYLIDTYGLFNSDTFVSCVDNKSEFIPELVKYFNDIIEYTNKNKDSIYYTEEERYGKKVNSTTSLGIEWYGFKISNLANNVIELGKEIRIINNLDNALYGNSIISNIMAEIILVNDLTILWLEYSNTGRNKGNFTIKHISGQTDSFDIVAFNRMIGLYGYTEDIQNTLKLDVFFDFTSPNSYFKIKTNLPTFSLNGAKNIYSLDNASVSGEDNPQKMDIYKRYNIKQMKKDTDRSLPSNNKFKKNNPLEWNVCHDFSNFTFLENPYNDNVDIFDNLKITRVYNSGEYSYMMSEKDDTSEFGESAIVKFPYIFKYTNFEGISIVVRDENYFEDNRLSVRKYSENDRVEGELCVNLSDYNIYDNGQILSYGKKYHKYRKGIDSVGIKSMDKPCDACPDGKCEPKKDGLFDSRMTFCVAGGFTSYDTSVYKSNGEDRYTSICGTITDDNNDFYHSKMEFTTCKPGRDMDTMNELMYLENVPTSTNSYTDKYNTLISPLSDSNPELSEMGKFINNMSIRYDGRRVNVITPLGDNLMDDTYNEIYELYDDDTKNNGITFETSDKVKLASQVYVPDYINQKEYKILYKWCNLDTDADKPHNSLYMKLFVDISVADSNTDTFVTIENNLDVNISLPSYEFMINNSSIEHFVDRTCDDYYALKYYLNTQVKVKLLSDNKIVFYIDRTLNSENNMSMYDIERTFKNKYDSFISNSNYTDTNDIGIYKYDLYDINNMVSIVNVADADNIIKLNDILTIPDSYKTREKISFESGNGNNINGLYIIDVISTKYDDFFLVSKNINNINNEFDKNIDNYSIYKRKKRVLSVGEYSQYPDAITYLNESKFIYENELIPLEGSDEYYVQMSNDFNWSKFNITSSFTRNISDISSYGYLPESNRGFLSVTSNIKNKLEQNKSYIIEFKYPDVDVNCYIKEYLFKDGYVSNDIAGITKNQRYYLSDMINVQNDIEGEDPNDFCYIAYIENYDKNVNSGIYKIGKSMDNFEKCSDNRLDFDMYTSPNKYLDRNNISTLYEYEREFKNYNFNMCCNDIISKNTYVNNDLRLQYDPYYKFLLITSHINTNSYNHFNRILKFVDIIINCDTMKNIKVISPHNSTDFSPTYDNSLNTMYTYYHYIYTDFYKEYYDCDFNKFKIMRTNLQCGLEKTYEDTTIPDNRIGQIRLMDGHYLSKDKLFYSKKNNKVFINIDNVDNHFNHYNYVSNPQIRLLDYDRNCNIDDPDLVDVKINLLTDDVPVIYSNFIEYDGDIYLSCINKTFKDHVYDGITINFHETSLSLLKFDNINCVFTEVALDSPINVSTNYTGKGRCSESIILKSTKLGIVIDYEIYSNEDDVTANMGRKFISNLLTVSKENGKTYYKPSTFKTSTNTLDYSPFTIFDIDNCTIGVPLSSNVPLLNGETLPAEFTAHNTENVIQYYILNNYNGVVECRSVVASPVSGVTTDNDASDFMVLTGKENVIQYKDFLLFTRIRTSALQNMSTTKINLFTDVVTFIVKHHDYVGLPNKGDNEIVSMYKKQIHGPVQHIDNDILFSIESGEESPLTLTNNTRIRQLGRMIDPDTPFIKCQNMIMKDSEFVDLYGYTATEETTLISAQSESNIYKFKDGTFVSFNYYHPGEFHKDDTAPDFTSNNDNFSSEFGGNNIFTSVTNEELMVLDNTNDTNSTYASVINMIETSQHIIGLGSNYNMKKIDAYVYTRPLMKFVDVNLDEEKTNVIYTE